MKKIRYMFFMPIIVFSIIFSGVTVSAANVSNSQIDGAINWAKSVNFWTGYNGRSFSGYCLAFVQLAYSSQGVTVGTWGNAQNAGNHLIVGYDMNPPRGALVFFSNRNGLGHVGISLGDGTYIHAGSDGTYITTLTSYNSKLAISYRGWGYPGKGNTLSSSGSSGSSSSSNSNTWKGVVHSTDGSLVINSIPKAGNQVGLIPEGATCTVYPDKTSGNWYWVSYNGISGYSYNAYIRRASNASSGSNSSSNTGSSSNTWTGVVYGTGSSLAINSAPKVGNQIGEMPDGATCTVYPDKTSGNWYWVSYNGISGYSYKSYIRQASGGSSSNTRVGVVRGTGSSLAINSVPKAGNQIGAIPEGATCTVYPDKTSGNWYWVSYNGISGYAYKSYIVLQ